MIPLTEPTEAPPTSRPVTETRPEIVTTGDKNLPALRRRLLAIFPFQVVLAGMVVVVLFALVRQGMNDPDIWWHLRNAQYLFSTHHLPRVDMFSFTVTGTPWLDHEWLSEIPYYLVYRAFGLRGVFCLYLLTVELILLGIYYFSTRYSGNVKASWVAS